jgi:hypothetical protein
VPQVQGWQIQRRPSKASDAAFSTQFQECAFAVLGGGLFTAFESAF